MNDDEEPGQQNGFCLSNFITRLITLSMIGDSFGKGDASERILGYFGRLCRHRSVGRVSHDLSDVVDTERFVKTNQLF